MTESDYTCGAQFLLVPQPFQAREFHVALRKLQHMEPYIPLSSADQGAPYIFPRMVAAVLP